MEIKSIFLPAGELGWRTEYDYIIETLNAAVVDLHPWQVISEVEQENMFLKHLCPTAFFVSYLKYKKIIYTCIYRGKIILDPRAKKLNIK